MRWNGQCAGSMSVTIKGMEIPDSRECTAFRVAKTTVRGEED